MSPVLFNRILRKMHHHRMNVSFAPWFWELLQEAFNKTMTANFTSSEPMKMLFTLDDDKNHHGYGRARNIKVGRESGLKRVWQVKDNKTRYNNHVMCYAVSDISLVSIFEHGHHVSEYKVFDEIVLVFFNLKGSAKPNLLNHKSGPDWSKNASNDPKNCAFFSDGGFKSSCIGYQPLYFHQMILSFLELKMVYTDHKVAPRPQQ